MIRRIIQKNESILQKIAEPVDIETEKVLCLKIVNDLKDTIEDQLANYPFAKGIGLNAPQIGYLKRIFIIKMPNEFHDVFINPAILSYSNSHDYQYEGCLSFFNYRGIVKRALKISIDYLDGYFQNNKKTFSFGYARLIQHEIDHLNGILYIDRLRNKEELITYDEYKKIGKLSTRNWNYKK